MALGSLPPWLQINPRDYLLATQAGAQMGHAISDATTRAFEEQERMKMAAEHQKSVLAQQAIENAAQRLAAERLENYRQQEIKNREAELGIQRQGLGLRGEGIDIQRQRVEDLAKTNEQRIKDAEERERDRQTQRDFMNEFRNRSLDLREQGLNRERPTTTKLEADEFGPALSGPIDSPDIVRRLKQRSDALQAKKNAPGLFQRALSTVFGSPAPSPAAGTIPLTPSPSPILPKKRVKVKGPTGQTGTIEEGDMLPDGWETVE